MYRFLIHSFPGLIQILLLCYFLPVYFLYRHQQYYLLFYLFQQQILITYLFYY